MSGVDLNPDPDLDNVAQIAYGIAEKIRNQPPRQLFDALVALAQQHPAKMAQLIMTYAAWFDTEQPVWQLWDRVQAVTDDHTLRGVA